MINLRETESQPMELSRGREQAQLSLKQQQELERKQTERLEQQRPNVEEQVNQYTDTALAAFNPEEQQKLKQALTDTAMQHGGRRPGIDHIAFTKEGNLRLFMTNAEDRILKPEDILGYSPKLQDPEQLRHIQTQLNGKLAPHLSPYSQEQSDQIKLGLSKELSELTGKNLHIDRIDTIEDAKLKVIYNRDQTLTFDPNEYLAHRELEQKLQQPDIPEDPHLLAFSQIREQTEQQLAPHLSTAELNSLQQNVLTNRISEAIQQLGGDNAHISQINPLEDGRLQIQLQGNPTELRIHPEALLAEQGLSDKPVAEGLTGIQSYRPGLNGPTEYTIQKGEGPVHIGKALFPDDQRLAQAASEVGLYNLQDQHSAKYQGGTTNRYITHIGDKASVDLSPYSEQDIDRLSANFALRQSKEHQRDIQIQQIQATREADQRQPQQELAQHTQQDKLNSLFNPASPDPYGYGAMTPPPKNHFWLGTAASIAGVSGPILSLNRGMNTPQSTQNTQTAQNSHNNTTQNNDHRSFIDKTLSAAQSQLDPYKAHFERAEKTLGDLLRTDVNDNSFAAWGKRQLAAKAGLALGAVHWGAETVNDTAQLSASLSNMYLDQKLSTLNTLSGGTLARHFQPFNDAEVRLQEREQTVKNIANLGTQKASEAWERYSSNPSSIATDYQYAKDQLGTVIREQLTLSREAYRSADLQRNITETKGMLTVGSFFVGAGTLKVGKAGKIVDTVADAANLAKKGEKVVEEVAKSVDSGLSLERKLSVGLDKSRLNPSMTKNIDVPPGKQFVEDPFVTRNTLKPNVVYKSGEFGEYTYITDQLGRITNAQAKDLMASNIGRLSHNKNTPGKLQGDHAGHLIADRFGGSPELDNLVSQLQKVNLSEYKRLENTWASAIEQGKKVSVDIEVMYNANSMRPDAFKVRHIIDNKMYIDFISNNK